MTYDQIEAAVTRFGTNTGGGFVDQQGREYLIRNIGLTRRLEDLRDTVVAYRQDQPVLLRQVADVDFAARVKRGDAGYRGKPAVILSVQKQPGADTVALTRQIEAALGGHPEARCRPAFRRPTSSSVRRPSSKRRSAA